MTYKNYILNNFKCPICNGNIGLSHMKYMYNSDDAFQEYLCNYACTKDNKHYIALIVTWGNNPRVEFDIINIHDNSVYYKIKQNYYDEKGNTSCYTSLQISSMVDINHQKSSVIKIPEILFDFKKLNAKEDILKKIELIKLFN